MTIAEQQSNKLIANFFCYLKTFSKYIGEKGEVVWVCIQITTRCG